LHWERSALGAECTGSGVHWERRGGRVSAALRAGCAEIAADIIATQEKLIADSGPKHAVTPTPLHAKVREPQPLSIHHLPFSISFALFAVSATAACAVLGF